MIGSYQSFVKTQDEPFVGASASSWLGGGLMIDRGAVEAAVLERNSAFNKAQGSILEEGKCA